MRDRDGERTFAGASVTRYESAVVPTNHNPGKTLWMKNKKWKFNLSATITKRERIERNQTVRERERESYVKLLLDILGPLPGPASRPGPSHDKNVLLDLLLRQRDPELPLLLLLLRALRLRRHAPKPQRLRLWVLALLLMLSCRNTKNRTTRILRRHLHHHAPLYGLPRPQVPRLLRRFLDCRCVFLLLGGFELPLSDVFGFRAAFSSLLLLSPVSEDARRESVSVARRPGSDPRGPVRVVVVGVWLGWSWWNGTATTAVGVGMALASPFQVWKREVVQWLRLYRCRSHCVYNKTSLPTRIQWPLISLPYLPLQGALLWKSNQTCVSSF